MKFVTFIAFLAGLAVTNGAVLPNLTPDTSGDVTNTAVAPSLSAVRVFSQLPEDPNELPKEPVSTHSKKLESRAVDVWVNMCKEDHFHGDCTQVAYPADWGCRKYLLQLRAERSRIDTRAFVGSLPDGWNDVVNSIGNDGSHACYIYQ